MYLTDKGLDLIEQQAHKTKNVGLLFQVQILRELREVKALLQIYQNPGYCGNNSANCAYDSKNKHC